MLDAYKFDMHLFTNLS